MIYPGASFRCSSPVLQARCGEFPLSDVSEQLAHPVGRHETGGRLGCVGQYYLRTGSRFTWSPSGSRGEARSARSEQQRVTCPPAVGLAIAEGSTDLLPTISARPAGHPAPTKPIPLGVGNTGTGWPTRQKDPWWVLLLFSIKGGFSPGIRPEPVPAGTAPGSAISSASDRPPPPLGFGLSGAVGVIGDQGLVAPMKVLLQRTHTCGQIVVPLKLCPGSAGAFLALGFEHLSLKTT